MIELYIEYNNLNSMIILIIIFILKDKSDQLNPKLKNYIEC